MAISNRITAQKIILKIDGENLACDANQIILTPEEAPGDVQTFCEESVGARWTCQIDGITSGDEDSLYRQLWALYGQRVPFILAPNGNEIPTVDMPHYAGTLIINQLPPMALNSPETAKFSVTQTVQNTPHNPAGGYYYGVQVITED